MSKIGYLGSFVVGGGIGALVAWIFTKKKYEKLADDEIRSAKEEFSKDSHIVIVHSEEEAKKVPSKDDIKEYEEKIKENHYTSYKQALENVKETVRAFEKEKDILPYPIEPDEQGESGFAKETLIWYEGDSTLSDESGKILDGPDDIIGFNNLDDFKGSDVIYIRNETEEVDYEVIRDPGSYSEAYDEIHNPNYVVREDY